MKVNDNPCRKGSLSRFLIINFAIFNLAIILALFLISLISTIVMNRITFLPDIDAFLQKASTMSDNEFEKMKYDKYLGKSVAFSILDENGDIIYSTDTTNNSHYEINELECIPEYLSDSTIYVQELPDGINHGKYLLTKEYYNNKGEWESEGYSFLDENLNIVSGSLFPKRTHFTELEIQYLKGFDNSGRALLKQGYQNIENKQYTLIFMTEKKSSQDYAQALRIERHIRWLIIPIYLLIAFFYAWWIIRKIKNFLKPLNTAVLNFSNGSPSNLKNYCGPNEFVDFANNFCCLESKLTKSETERKRLDNQRQKLLADISHDLKTPITVIQGYAVALRDGIVPLNEQGKYLDTIIHKSEKMTELLSDFHEYSKLEHPEIPIFLKRKDICAVMQKYFADRYQEITLSGFQIEADIPDNSIFCEIDEKLFYRAMENIVNNAVKYNPIGTCIFVSLKSDNKNVFISICDNGIGIANSLKDTLFEAFITGDPARGKEHGSGLGLAITKKIINLHHGSITLLQDTNQRYITEFLMILPIC